MINNRMYLWGAETTTDTSGAIYELHALTKDFSETTARGTTPPPPRVVQRGR
ncbi:hypothetical protein GCM10019016_027400 [Streptomyces prasinosporus]|uniref:Uncharacterized protein n=1 Tax=Streptomyces prasinosporus TaxID=68256 RepID=A0ABP6TKA2_9ACTN